MPKPRKNEEVRCTNFTWKLRERQGVYFADGRSNTPNAGRHSLGTADRNEALRILPELDRKRAEDLGLIPRSAARDVEVVPLSLEDGRKLYETHAKRPRVTGGVRASTAKKYKSVFDKFIPFAKSCGITVWNGVDADLLTAYASHLESKGYAHKTQSNELVTLKQAIKWLVHAGHLTNFRPVELKLLKAESEPAYCYRKEEIRAMIEHCRSIEGLGWLGNLIIALVCTGLRIAELASLRWADVDLSNLRLNLTDETGRAIRIGRAKRELKSGRSRSFPIHPDLAAVLMRLAKSDAYVFHGPRGGRLKPDTIRNILIREVIRPLEKQFPTPEGEKGFRDGRLHSFRHAFCSICANSNTPERMVMEWLGHSDSAMVRWYYHMHDDESRQRMAGIDFLGGATGNETGTK